MAPPAPVVDDVDGELKMRACDDIDVESCLKPVSLCLKPLHSNKRLESSRNGGGGLC